MMIPVPILILATLFTGVLVCWLVVEIRYSNKMNDAVKEALDGWRRAIELHEQDRATFAGQQKLKDQWPEIV